MRVAWIIWSSAWAVFWLTFGWFILPLLNVPLGLASIGLALLPVGQQDMIDNTFGNSVHAPPPGGALPSSFERGHPGR